MCLLLKKVKPQQQSCRQGCRNVYLARRLPQKPRLTSLLATQSIHSCMNRKLVLVSTDPPMVITVRVLAPSADASPGISRLRRSDAPTAAQWSYASLTLEEISKGHGLVETTCPRGLTNFWWTHSVHSARNLKSGLVWMDKMFMSLVWRRVRMFTHFSWTCWTLIKTSGGRVVNGRVTIRKRLSSSG